jgi:RNA binding exosome subunit
MIHNIRFRVFIYSYEDENEVLESLKNVLNDIEFNKEIAEGIDEKPIIILSGRINKKKNLKNFINNLKTDENFNLKDFLSKLDKKIDKNGNLFIRLSKESAKNGEFKIINGGDSIHLKIKIAAYPSKKEIAIPIAESLFS